MHDIKEIRKNPVFFTKKKKKETVYKQRCSGVSSTVIRDRWQMVKNFNLRYTLGQ